MGRGQSIVNQDRFLVIRVCISATLILLLMSSGAYAMGKRFSEQGGKLTAAMNNALLSKGFCKTPRECYDILPGATDHDDMVRINFYEIGAKNYAAFLAVIDLTLKDGVRITDGVPITIKAYRETHEDYRNSGLLIKDVKPFMIMEVNK